MKILKQTKAKLITATTTALAMGNRAMTVYANNTSSGGDPTSNINKTLTSLQTLVGGIAVATGVLAIMLGGILFMAGDTFSKQATSWIVKAMVGLIIVSGAATIGGWAYGLW